jgi:hypothetical protein
MTNFDSMGKVDLRAACKSAGIKGYGKMTVNEMRHALYANAAKSVDVNKLDENGVDGHCPHCGINLDNGVATYADILDSNKEGAADMKRDIVCLGCGGEWGAEVVRHSTADRHTGTGLKIEKNREERNGVKRPSVGGKCRVIWDFLDAVYQGGKVMPTSAMVKEAAENNGWNPNNASIEFYQWRKFNGISGRQK